MVNPHYICIYVYNISFHSIQLLTILIISDYNIHNQQSPLQLLYSNPN